MQHGVCECCGAVGDVGAVGGKNRCGDCIDAFDAECDREQQERGARNPMRDTTTWTTVTLPNGEEILGIKYWSATEQTWKVAYRAEHISNEDYAAMSEGDRAAVLDMLLAEAHEWLELS